MTDKQKLEIAVDAMETVIRRIDQGEAHVAQLHIWQKGDYILSLSREAKEILSTAVKIARDNSTE